MATANASSASPTNPASIYPVYASHIPLSIRRAPPLDMSSVERRGQVMGGAREAAKRTRPHGLLEAPTFRPSLEEFADPMEYIRKIAPEGRRYGVCKIIPPESWQPDFAIDTEVSRDWQGREIVLIHIRNFTFELDGRSSTRSKAVGDLTRSSLTNSTQAPEPTSTIWTSSANFTNSMV